MALVARLVHWCVLSPLVVILACAGDDDESPQQAFVSRYAELMCPRLTPCCTATGEQNDVGACKRLIGLLAGSSAAKFNQGAADACLDALAGWSCTEDEPDVCDNVLSGTVQPGGSCDSSTDCAAPVSGGVTCHHDFSSGSSSKGTCKIKPVPKAGQPCGAEASTATEYFVCDQEPAFYCDSGTCKAKAAIGQACSGYSSCEPGAVCEANTCVALAGIGESCGQSGCVEGAYCDTGGKCAKKKAMGEPCQEYDECQGSCDISSGTCHPNATICFSD